MKSRRRTDRATGCGCAGIAHYRCRAAAAVGAAKRAERVRMPRASLPNARCRRRIRARPTVPPAPADNDLRHRHCPAGCSVGRKAVDPFGLLPRHCSPASAASADFTPRCPAPGPLQSALSPIWRQRFRLVVGGSVRARHDRPIRRASPTVPDVRARWRRRVFSRPTAHDGAVAITLLGGQ